MGSSGQSVMARARQSESGRWLAAISEEVGEHAEGKVFAASQLLDDESAPGAATFQATDTPISTRSRVIMRLEAGLHT